MINKIIIFSGTFNPIHLGHLTMALQSLELSGAKKLYFLPERAPINKAAEHFGHRVAMIKNAIKPYPNMGVLELNDKKFSVKRTLPELQKLFPGDKLIFIFGSNKIYEMDKWPNSKTLFSSVDFIIGLLDKDSDTIVKKITSKWPDCNITVIHSYSKDISSTNIRDSIGVGNDPRGLLRSVAKYIRNNWLYIRLNRNI